MINRKILLGCCVSAIAISPIYQGINQAHCMEAPARSEMNEINKLSEEVRSLYYNLVLSQATRAEKKIPVHDWMRISDTVGKTLKGMLGLNKDSARQNGLTSFYQKFLTSDQRTFDPFTFAYYILPIARMQGACSDPSKGYAATFFDKSKSGSYDNILVEQYVAPSGVVFDVTPYSFFVGALKEIPNFKNLSAADIKQIKQNLEDFKSEIQKHLG